MVRRETARLRAIFERTLLLLSATASAMAGANGCASEAGQGSGAGDGAQGDASAPGDSSAEAAIDASVAQDSGSLWAPGCEPSAPVEYDAGSDAPNCEYRIALPCGVPSFVTSIDPIRCTMSLSSCIELCTGAAFPFLNCEVANGFGCDDDAQAFVAADGAPIVVQCDKCTIAGRRPAGLVNPGRPSAARSVLGGFFAEMAYLEGASVIAFQGLSDDLLRLRAPRVLVRAARRSAGDEVRHACVTARMAGRFGAEPPVVRVAHRRARPTAAIAVENVVEGCVRETFGALVASWQATHASDPGIARSMARIAADEIRHAALAWAIARWMETRLDHGGRRKVMAACRRAVRRLLRETNASPPAVLVTRAGLPSAATARAMIGHLQASLWQPLAR